MPCQFLRIASAKLHNRYSRYGLSRGDYDGNGGSTQAPPIIVKYGNKYIVDGDIPVRGGYDFIGWNTKPDGSGVSLSAGDEYDGNDGWTLYAQWAPKSIAPATFDGGITAYIATIVVIILGMVATAGNYTKR